VKIYHGERYAQGELQEVIGTEFELIKERPKQKTDRTGGLGHTGTK
jgi:dUTPase